MWAAKSVKTEQFSDILWTAAKFTKWTFFQQSSNWSYQDRLKCTKRALFHKFIYESKALRNEHFPNSIQSELCGLIVQTGHFSKSIYGAAKGMKMNCFPTALKWLEVYKWNTFPTFFNGNKAYELNILPTAFKLKWSGQPKVYKGENFPTNLYTTAKPRKWTFSYSLRIEMSEIPWS